jgi:hypothetical protein
LLLVLRVSLSVVRAAGSLLDTLDAIATAVFDRVDASADSLGISIVQFGDMPLTAKWPAVMVVPNELTRRPEASQYVVELQATVLLYVLHADMTVGRQVRTHEDLQLAEAVTNVLHANMTFDGQLAGSWVSAERPRMVPTRRAPQVVSTELTWVARSRGRIG